MASSKCGVLFCLVLIWGTIQAQEDNTLPDLKDLEQKLKDQLPPELSAIGDINLEDPQIKKSEQLLSEKCAKNGHPEAVQQIKDSKDKIQTCLTDIVNIPKFEKQIEEAKKTGSMDEVFGEYCQKYPAIRQCLDEVEEHVVSCLDSKEAEAFNASMDAVKEIKEFLCFKDGDRLAMFYAEGGPECIQEKTEQIQSCVNETFGDRLPNHLSADSLPAFLFTQQDCSDFDVVGQCIVKEMEQCATNTPANIVDAFFKFLKKNTPCRSSTLQGVHSAESTENSATSITSNFLVAAVALYGLLLRFY